MSKTNQWLALTAAVLLVGSAVVYHQSVARADRFERGQKFLPNLNPDEVARIVVKKTEESVTLNRKGDSFLVEQADGYPAKNDAVNRLLRDLMEIGLEKDVGRGESLEAELELEPMGESSFELVLENAARQEMVRVRVGRAFTDGSGHYVRRLDQEDGSIYLTSKSLYLNTSVDAYLKKEIVDAPESDLERIQGIDYLFERDDSGNLQLVAVPGGSKVKTSEANSVKSALSRLSFDKVYPADDDEVRGLDFRQTLRVDLQDGSGYVLSTANRGERTFLRIEGFHSVERVEIAQDTPEEELQEKAEILSRAEEIETFNTFHGSWVYELTDFTAKKLQKRKGDLTEKA